MAVARTSMRVESTIENNGWCIKDESVVVLYCTYMHPYIYTVSRTTSDVVVAYNTSGPCNLMLSGHANY